MKKTVAFCLLLLLPASLSAQPAPPAKESRLDWSEFVSVPLGTKPLGVVHSLDGRRFFVLGADSYVYVYSSPDGKKIGSIPVDKGVTAIDIAPRGDKLFLINSEKNTFTGLDISFTASIDLLGAPMRGQADAPVTLVVFSDFQCPHCKTVKPLVEELLQKNPATLKVAFKNLPLRMHELAEPAARAAIAAQNQGKFWEMHDMLFTEPQLSMVKIIEAAQKLGLNMEQFNKEMNDEATRQKLTKDMMDANEADVTGTPALFINGRRVAERNAVAMQKMIDQELKNISSAKSK